MKQHVRMRVDLTIELDTETPDNLPPQLCNVSLSATLLEGLIAYGLLPNPTTVVHGERRIEVVQPKKARAR